MSKPIQSPAQPGRWAYGIVGAVALVLFLCAYGQAYTPGTGITKLIQIGREFDNRGLAVFKATPKQVDSRWGFDGQFYAELALDPLLRDPQMKIALDNPAYRARRILMPWLARAGGLGRPFWILNVYAALNLVFWVGFAGLMAVLFRPHGWAGLAGFSAMLMTCGIIESMRASLTDFPSFVLLTGAMMLGGTGGAVIVALSALMREANILGVLGLLDYRPPWLATARRNVILGLIAGLPLALWSAYVFTRLPSVREALAGGNLVWPLQGIIAKLGEFSVQAQTGAIWWRNWYSEIYTNDALHALLTIISVLTQCLYLLTHREWDNRIWRAGMIFVPYFLCISFIPWVSHFTVTRHALTITLAFNLILAMHRRRSWLVWFLLGNCFVPYGIYVFTIKDSVFTKYGTNPPPEYRLEAAPAAPRIGLRFGRGWHQAEWTRRDTWRWGAARHATLVLANPTTQPVEVRLAFMVSSILSRDLKITAGGSPLWTTPLLQEKISAETLPFQLPPGETVVELESAEPAQRPGNGNLDHRLLSFMLMDPRIIVGGSAAAAGSHPQ